MNRVLAKIRNERQGNGSQKQTESDNDSADDGAAGESGGNNGLIQDQIILAPEIMTKILEHLDFRALKNVRLVCKSWLLEAQSHMETRGMVGLGGNDKCYTTRIQEFIELRANKVPALPQPFGALEVDLDCCSGPACSRDHKQILSQLGSFLPPLLLTRFSPEVIPLNVVLPLIIQCSSSLEFLKLCAWDCEEGFRIPVPGSIPAVQFQNLRELDIDAGVINYTEKLKDFPETVAWIMKASPNMCTFQTWVHGTSYPLEGIANEVLLEVDLKNATSLSLGGFSLEYATMEHLASTPFSRLHTLSMRNYNEYAHEALVALVKRAATTLKCLDLRDAESHLLVVGTNTEFPVCPYLQKLELHLFPGWGDCVARCFPALEYFSPAVYYSRREKQLFREASPFPGVKDLRLRDAVFRYERSFRPKELFATFPALERLSIHPSFLFEHFGMKPSSDPIFLDVLKGLKHLELEETDSDWFDTTHGAGYAFIAGLKGVETIKVTTMSEVTKMPVGELPCLQALQFYWGYGSNELNTEKLLEMARGVGSVVILNHCSIMRERQSRSAGLLQEFFDSAPNAVCGCN